MKESWTRRQFIVRAGVAVAAVQTFQNLDPCCMRGSIQELPVSPRRDGLLEGIDGTSNRSMFDAADRDVRRERFGRGFSARPSSASCR